MSYEKLISILEEVDKSILEGQGDGPDQLTLLRMVLESSEKYNHPLKNLEKGLRCQEERVIVGRYLLTIIRHGWKSRGTIIPKVR